MWRVTGLTQDHLVIRRCVVRVQGHTVIAVALYMLTLHYRNVLLAVVLQVFSSIVYDMDASRVVPQSAPLVMSVSGAMRLRFAPVLEIDGLLPQVFVPMELCNQLIISFLVIFSDGLINIEFW